MTYELRNLSTEFSRINGQLGNMNAPTVLNSSFNFRQFWDGRSPDLAEQALHPVENPKEMGATWEEVVVKLKKDQVYPRLFSRLFPEKGISKETITRAISAFEMSLITPNSPFDLWLQGQNSKISEEALKGYKLFKKNGCISCHQGINIGGNMYQTMGKFSNYFEDRGNITKEDYGLFNLTGRPEDKFRFKVPSLRNVELTAPYFHDGSVKTLEKAVEIMSFYQTGK